MNKTIRYVHFQHEIKLHMLNCTVSTAQYVSFYLLSSSYN